MCSLMRTVANSNGIFPTFDSSSSSSNTMHTKRDEAPHVPACASLRQATSPEFSTWEKEAPSKQRTDDRQFFVLRKIFDRQTNVIKCMAFCLSVSTPDSGRASPARWTDECNKMYTFVCPSTIRPPLSIYHLTQWPFPPPAARREYSHPFSTPPSSRCLTIKRNNHVQGHSKQASPRAQEALGK